MAGEKLRSVAYRISTIELSPIAQNKVEGIIGWWLLDRFNKCNVRVKDPLEELVAADLVRERRGKEARIYYKISPQKLKQISALVRARSRPLVWPE